MKHLICLVAILGTTVGPALATVPAVANANSSPAYGTACGTSGANLPNSFVESGESEKLNRDIITSKCAASSSQPSLTSPPLSQSTVLSASTPTRTFSTNASTASMPSVVFMRAHAHWYLDTM